MPQLDSLNRSALTRARLAVSTFFFANGYVFATWVPMIPAVKDRHGLSDATLGLVLFAISVGAVLALRGAGRVVGRFGSRSVTRAAGLSFCLGLPLVIASAHVWSLVIVLMVFGALNALLDVAMNAQAVDVENRMGQAIMSSFHALFSLGGLAGAGITGLSLGAGLSELQHALITSALFALGLLLASANLAGVDDRDSARSPTLGRLPKGLLGLGLLAFLGLLVEGAMADWSALYLRDTLDSSTSQAALGFAAFSACMALGRFTGDALVRRFGARQLLRLSGALATAGMALGVWAPSAHLAVVGFGLVGLGASNIIPLLFSAAGRMGGATPAHTIAMVASVGYLGLLAGPPLIGIIAQITTMRFAMGLLAIACVIIALRAGEAAR